MVKVRDKMKRDFHFILFFIIFIKIIIYIKGKRNLFIKIIIIIKIQMLKLSRKNEDIGEPKK